MGNTTHLYIVMELHNVLLIKAVLFLFCDVIYSNILPLVVEYEALCASVR